MGRRTKRAASGLVATTAALAIALSSSASCTLYSTGLGDVMAPGDGGADANPGVPQIDATSPEAAVDSGTSEADDAGGEAALADGARPCASIESDCLDGLDDDCNGLTDCADPACTEGYVCVPAATGGWSGYGLYEDGRTAACPDAYGTQVDTDEGVLASPATCSACACTAAGASCGGSSRACGLACLGGPLTMGAGCDDFTAPIALDGTSGCSASVPTAVAGTCASSGGAPTLSPVGFSKLSRTCGTTHGPGGGCGTGTACVARAPAATHGVCVFQGVAGTTLCPAGYPHAHVVMPDGASVTDTRGCTSCGCGLTLGASCGGSVTLDPAAACDAAGVDDDAGAPVTFAADGLCHAALVTTATSFASGSLQTAVTSQGGCLPSGGAASGSVTPANQTTWCCQD